MISLGYRTNNDYNRTVISGFMQQRKQSTKKILVKDDGEAHLITVAPTGAGKGRSAVIPTCASYEGSMIILDIKGEAFLTTADIRKKKGEVYVLDPFNCVTGQTDKFNPMDIADVNDRVETQGTMIANALQTQQTIVSDPFWDNKASELISALTIHELTTSKSFVKLRKRMFAADVDYELAVLLDKKEITSDLARELLEAYLQITSDKTRPCVLTTAQQHLAILGNPAVLNALEGPSSFNVQDILSGKPVSIYIVIPPNKITAYATLLRLWITSFLFLFTERKSRPEIPTLFIVDECGNLGRLESLVSAITLLRSYGLRVWTFFQDLGQMKTLYPHNWTTIINNCDVVQTFGMRNFLMAEEISKLFGDVTARQMLFLPQDECYVARAGKRTERLTRLDYLNDKHFKKYKFKSNPFYANINKNGIHKPQP